MVGPIAVPSTDPHTGNQVYTTPLLPREAQVVADDANDRPIVATASQNVAKKIEKFTNCFGIKLPGNADKNDRIHEEICH